MQGDALPDQAGAVGGDAAGGQEGAGLVGAVELEALPAGAELLGETEVVEEGSHVEQLRVEVQAVTTAVKSRPYRTAVVGGEEVDGGSRRVGGRGRVAHRCGQRIAPDLGRGGRRTLGAARAGRGGELGAARAGRGELGAMSWG